MMNRRKFLSYLGISSAAIVIPMPALAASDRYADRFVRPVSPAVSSNNMLSVDQITREALKIAHQKLHFLQLTATKYPDNYRVGSDTLKIRRPASYKSIMNQRHKD